MKRKLNVKRRRTQRTYPPKNIFFTKYYPCIPEIEIRATIVPCIRRIQTIKDRKVLIQTEKSIMRLISRINSFYAGSGKKPEALSKMREEMIQISINHLQW